MILLQDPTDWFARLVDRTNVREPTKAYIVGVMLHATKSTFDVDNSVVLAYARVHANSSFEGFQSLGDWILWSMIFTPQFHASHEGTVVDIGRMCYDACWRILRGRWELYLELADRLPELIDVVKLSKDTIDESHR